MSLSKYLENWDKTHPIYDPAQEQPETINKTIDYLVSGGDSPLPLWPKLKGKKQ